MCYQISVSCYSIPMMDLLVNLSASSKLNPAGHTIVILSEETGKPRDYKPNHTIGSLCSSQNPDKKVNRLTVHIKSKKYDRKPSAGNTSNVQPFEVNYLLFLPETYIRLCFYLYIHLHLLVKVNVAVRLQTDRCIYLSTVLYGL